MIVEAKRKKGEHFEGFFRRFNKKLLYSGQIFQARKVRYFTKPVNKNKKRQTAVKRSEINERLEYLTKTGRLKDDKKFGRRR